MLLKDCPTGWEGPHRDICYRLSEDARSWTDAKANGCEALSGGAYLASVTYANKAFLSKQESISRLGLLLVFNTVSICSHRCSPCLTLLSPLLNPVFQPQNSDGSCSDGWTSVGSDCYAMTEALSFSEAELACTTKMADARLAAVYDYDTLSAGLDIGTAGYLWIGLRSTPAADGALRWLANGEEVSDTPWKYVEYDEPDSEIVGDDADCVAVNGLEAAELYRNGRVGRLLLQRRVQVPLRPQTLRARITRRKQWPSRKGDSVLERLSRATALLWVASRDIIL
ncbi:hypothetical protein FJT64_011986 [Amphibalanus amphitrite]|uniref:C-type lectin domain-containing protein n=1 Tax=Amphibalanus amphitrite TaxID=1232801 RepID=A0A6A4VHG2_AMPAM|nr:hypothetical protein FJT64_011986 [Amphibalanus amphitrite]